MDDDVFDERIIAQHFSESNWYRSWPRLKQRDCPICQKSQCWRSPDGKEYVCLRGSMSTNGFLCVRKASHFGMYFINSQRRQQIIDDYRYEQEQDTKNAFRRMIQPALARPDVAIAPAQKVQRKQHKDFQSLHDQYHQDAQEHLDKLADNLGLPVDVLRQMECGYQSSYGRDVMTISERNEFGKITAIIKRSTDGKRWTENDSHRGLTYCEQWDVGGPILLPEGITDTLAAVAYGWPSLGRPSTNSGQDIVALMLKDIPKDRQIIIVGDNDPRPNAEGEIEIPGRTGAEDSAQKIANILCRNVILAFPPKPYKDIRECWNAGVSAEDFRKHILAAEELIVPEPTPVLLDGRPSDEPPKTITEYREELGQNIVSAISEPGMSLIKGPTGVGKSIGTVHAIRDVCIQGVKRSERIDTVTCMPTHKNCNERLEEMERYGSLGNCTAVIPELTEDNCENYDEALIALNAGMSVGQALCPKCPYQKGCDFVRQVSKAKNKQHLICSAERVIRGSTSEWFTDRQVLIIDEKPDAVLAPEIVATLAELRTVQDYFQQVAELVRPQPMDLDKWTPNAIDDACMGAAAICEECSLVAESLVDQSTDIHAPGSHPASIVYAKRFDDQKVQQQLLSAIRKGSRDGVLDLPPASASRLVMQIVGGGASSVDLIITKKQKKLVRVHAKPNLSGKSVLMLDGTGDQNHLSALLGAEVQDMTPSGRLEEKHDLRQVVLSVSKKKSAAEVCRIITTLMEENLGRTFGIIGHKGHITKIFGDRSKSHDAILKTMLPPYLRPFVAMTSYFGQGPDRGSNQWHESCDMLLVIGSPRTPEQCIRGELAAIRSDSASANDGFFGKSEWIGTDDTGAEQTYQSLHYKDAEWRQAHIRQTRSALLQAVGRARTTLETGIPCVVVADEPLGIVTRSADVAIRTDRHQTVLNALVSASMETILNAWLNLNPDIRAELEAAKEAQSLGNKCCGSLILIIIGHRNILYPMKAEYRQALDGLLLECLQQYLNPAKVFDGLWLRQQYPAMRKDWVRELSSLEDSVFRTALAQMEAAGEIHYPSAGWVSLGKTFKPCEGVTYYWNGGDSTISRIVEAIEQMGGQATRQQIAEYSFLKPDTVKKAINSTDCIVKIKRGLYGVACRPYLNDAGDIQSQAPHATQDNTTIIMTLSETPNLIG